MRPHPTTRPGYRPPIERRCQNPACGATFWVNPADVRRGRGLYCSHSCKGKGRPYPLTRAVRSPRLTLTCETCGKSFQTTERAHARSPRRFCDRDCYLNRERDDVARFWKYVQKAGPDDCWWWTGGRKRGGGSSLEYGELGWPTAKKTRMEQAHRISYLIHKGPIPDDLCVCHTCDHPLCVNPAHLFLDTLGGNTRDMWAKGRSRARPSSGEKNGLSKLTEQAVREIRSRYVPGNVRLIDLAAEYGVTFSSIANVVTRKTWRHVE